MRASYRKLRASSALAVTPSLAESAHVVALLLRRALAIREKALGLDHPSVADTPEGGEEGLPSRKAGS